MLLIDYVLCLVKILCGSAPGTFQSISCLAADGQLRCSGKPQAFPAAEEVHARIGCFPGKPSTTANNSLVPSSVAPIRTSTQVRSSPQPDVEVDAVGPPINVALLSSSRAGSMPCNQLREPTLSLTMLVADGPEAFSPLDRCQGFTKISESRFPSRYNAGINASTLECPAHKPR